MLLRGVLLSCSAAQSDVTPGPESVPEWAQQGKFRFTRFDGGPLQVCKTTRSARLKHFNEQQKEVLANLYTKYGDRMADLLAEAHINWVWITWSVGFSEADEAEQRAQCKIITDKLHKRGIKVAAYMCAVSVFWESMFRDHPRSVRWIKFDPEGTPFRYTGGKDALRFIADLSNPDWLACQKRRVGGIINARLDAIFFDDTASPGWNTKEDLESFFRRTAPLHPCREEVQHHSVHQLRPAPGRSAAQSQHRRSSSTKAGASPARGVRTGKRPTCAVCGTCAA